MTGDTVLQPGSEKSSGVAEVSNPVAGQFCWARPAALLLQIRFGIQGPEPQERTLGYRARIPIGEEMGEVHVAITSGLVGDQAAPLN